MRFLLQLVHNLKSAQTKSDQTIRLAQFSTYDARRFFSSIVERARRGEEIVIARSGVPVAKVVPFTGEPTRPGSISVRVVVRDVPDRRKRA